VWADEITAHDVVFINEDIEQFNSERRFDFVICVNAFMYFASARAALSNLLRATRRHLLIRSYFADANYRIMRAQTMSNHDKSTVSEVDVFDENGNMRCYDFWNIYSCSYMEALVKSIDPKAKLEWLEDENMVASMEQERSLRIE
jgi:hypothetical protein